MDGTAFWVMAILASFCVGMAKGGVPVISAMGVPILALVISPVTAAGLLLPVYIVADAFGVYNYRKTFNTRVLKIFGVAMPIGVLIGYLTSASVPEAAVTLVIGLIAFWFSTAMIFRRTQDDTPQPARVKPGLFWGVITGFTSFVAHSGAAPYQVYTLPLGMDKITFAGTVTIAFAYINLIKLIPYYALGQLSVENLQTAAVLCVPAIAGVFAGVKLVRVMPEKLFFQIIVWALFVLSLRLIWSGTTGLFA